jgi:hypothetical protein
VSYHHTHPKARQPHHCWMCGRTIRPGETYMRGAALDGGTAWTWKECAHCERLVTFINSIAYEDEYGEDLVIEWEPATIAEARVRAQWKRRWTTLAGDLYPVPVILKHTNDSGFVHFDGVEPGVQYPQEVTA